MDGFGIFAGIGVLVLCFALGPAGCEYINARTAQEKAKTSYTAATIVAGGKVISCTDDNVTWKPRGNVCYMADKPG